jgi:lycopene beta-cyclase
MPRHDADLIIAGAGCAGLSALWHVLHGPARDRRIIVVDRSFEPVDDRTWSFWGTTDAPFAHLADRSVGPRACPVPRLGDDRSPPRPRRPSPTGRRTYMRVRRRAYDQYVLDLAANRPNVRFVSQDIVGIRDEADGGVVTLPEGELRAPLVLQSAQLSPLDRDAPVRHPLRQHFGGWEVRTERPVFDRRWSR